MTRVALLGTGIMGAGMARNLAGAGLEVAAWNRTVEKAAAIADEVDGVTVAGSPSGALAGADALVTMLIDADATVEALGDGLADAPDELVWIQSGTVGLEGTDRLAALADEEGIAFVDAPVLGTKAPAEAGELIVLASGPDDARRSCQPVFDAIGKRTLWLGPAGAGTRLKLVANSWVLSLVEGLAEAFALAQALDVDPSLLLQAIEGGPLDAGYAQLKGQAILDEDYTPSFPLSGAAKDARLICEAAEAQGAQLPMLAAIAEQMARGAESSHAGEDMIATYKTSAPGS